MYLFIYLLYIKTNKGLINQMKNNLNFMKKKKKTMR